MHLATKKRKGTHVKKTLCFLLVGLLVLCLSACSFGTSSPIADGSPSPAKSSLQIEKEEVPSMETTHPMSESGEPSTGESKEKTVMEQTTFYVTVEENTFFATFADNSGAQALRDLLAKGDITIQMSDYAGFEKVGSLGQSLPTSNSQTTTQAGDIVLYQGNQIVIFYGSNSWSYTRLGRIDDLTGWTEALGSGSVSVTFSLQK